MKNSTAATLFKIIVGLAGIIGCALFFSLTSTVNYYGIAFPEFKYLVLPSSIAIWASALPCYGALILFWRISSRVANGNSFCKEDVAALQLIGKLAIADTILCFLVLATISLNHAANPGVLIIALSIMIGGIIAAVLTTVLAHLVKLLIHS
jgi:hypothetical protein